MAIPFRTPRHNEPRSYSYVESPLTSSDVFVGRYKAGRWCDVTRDRFATVARKNPSWQATKTPKWSFILGVIGASERSTNKMGQRFALLRVESVEAPEVVLDGQDGDSAKADIPGVAADCIGPDHVASARGVGL